jgi:hypothetical protein
MSKEFFGRKKGRHPITSICLEMQGKGIENV